MSKLIPEDKVKGLRFGQLLHSALLNHGAKYSAHMIDDCKGLPSGSADHYIADNLFYIENDQLEAAVAHVLEGIGTPETTTSNNGIEGE